MVNQARTAALLIPDRPTISSLQQAAAGCRACDLWKDATQTVFGEGVVKARVLMVGEQPGDQEDLQGRPFVGPAGKILDQALEEAGIDRKEIYLTNAVKHFRWEPRGKRRIHKKPNSIQIAACKPWVEVEIGLIRPNIIVCLGATAAQALLGKQFKVSIQRGKFVESTLARYVMATVHPSSLLRAPDAETRRRETLNFIADLKRVRAALDKSTAA